MLDTINASILAKRTAAYNSVAGCRVGDFIQMQNGSIERISHDWGDTVQTTDGQFGASFYLGDTGVSFSGGLNPSVPKSRIKELQESKEGKFWFFNHDVAKAHNGIDVTVQCRFFIETR